MDDDSLRDVKLLLISSPCCIGCSTNFFLAWTTSAESFSLRYRRTIESTLAYHPTACIIVYSPTLPMDYFQRFWDLGYNIIVERPNVAYLLRGTPAEVW